MSLGERQQLGLEPLGGAHGLGDLGRGVCEAVDRSDSGVSDEPRRCNSEHRTCQPTDAEDHRQPAARPFDLVGRTSDLHGELPTPNAAETGRDDTVRLAVATRDGHPIYTHLRVVPGFTKEAMRDYATDNIEAGARVLTDGLACFNGFADEPISLDGGSNGGPAMAFLAALLIGFGIAQLAARKVLAVAILAVVCASFAVIGTLAEMGDVADVVQFADLLDAELSWGLGVPVLAMGSLVGLGGAIATLAKRRR